MKVQSVHKTQPWKFLINGDSIEFTPNYNYKLHVIDPDNRELFISIGCAIQNMIISAAKVGYTHSMTIKGNKSTITFHKTEGYLDHSLFDSIAHRQTRRGEYDGRFIPDIDVFALRSIGINVYRRDTQEFANIASDVSMGYSILMNNASFRKELQQWRKHKGHQSPLRLYGLSYDYLAPRLPRILSAAVEALMLNGKTQKKTDITCLSSSSHIAVIEGNNSKADWIRIGMLLELSLLICTKKGISYSFTNQPCVIDWLADSLQYKLGLENRPQIILRLGYCGKKPFTKRRKIESFVDITAQ